MASGVRDEIGNIAAIEGLRGLAVIWVLVFHYYVVRAEAFPADPWIQVVLSSVPVTVIVSNGFLGVDLFFLITGFLLTLQWFRHAEQGLPPPAARDFYRRRALRILPAYYVQLIFIFFICIPLLRDLTFWKTDLRYYLVNLSAHVMMVHYMTPLTSTSLGINGALWTLALEAQYYVLLPLLAPLLVRGPRTGAVVLVAIAILWRWAAAYDLKPIVDAYMTMSVVWNLPESKIRQLLGTQLPAYLAHFAAGILCGYYWLRWRARTPMGWEKFAWPLVAITGLAILFSMHSANGIRLGDYTWTLIPLSMGMVMLAVVSSGGGFARPLLANAPLLFAGRISYSTYLYHLPLLLLWNKFSPPSGWASLPVYAAIVVGVGYLSWRFVEVPYLKRRG